MRCCPSTISAEISPVQAFSEQAFKGQVFLGQVFLDQVFLGQSVDMIDHLFHAVEALSEIEVQGFRLTGSCFQLFAAATVEVVIDHVNRLA